MTSAEPRSALAVEDRAGVAVLTIDDGARNALSIPLLCAVEAALDEVLPTARAVMIQGRPGCLSAGFDLRVMRQGSLPEVMRLVEVGARFLCRLALYPRPVVIASAGHAVAGGALMLLAADHRIGVDGPFRIGLNEVAIGMVLPRFGTEMALGRLTPAGVGAAAAGRLLDPRNAASVGYLDEIVGEPDLDEIAIDAAAALGRLDATAFAGTKQRLRGAVVGRILDTLPTDLAALEAAARSTPDR